MSPEQTQGYIASIRGPNSTGKSELARAISVGVQEQAPHRATRVVHVGDLFRFFADHGLHEIPPEDTGQLMDSARAALAKVHLRVDQTTGEIQLAYNGDTGAFTQTMHNGFNAGALGANSDLTGLVHWYIQKEILAEGPPGSLYIFDGRERYDSDGVVIRTHAILPTRVGFFKQERPEAAGMDDEAILEKIQKRDVQEEHVLAGSMHDSHHVIHVVRTDPRIETTKRLGRAISGILLQCVDGKPPSGFGTEPITVRDTDI